MTPALDRQRYLACLSDPSRFSLVSMLASGPRCVTDLARLVGLSQSCTTRHLQALLREGIVSGQRQGKRVVYSLGQEDGHLHPVLAWVCAHPAAPDPDRTPEPRRTRPRTNGAASRKSYGEAHDPASQLEPEMAFLSAGVEHESGWVAGDAMAAEHADHRPTADPAESATAGHESHSSARSPFARRDLDDFLL